MTTVANPSLEGIACRSVHLVYPGEQADAFYHEITVANSAAGTYFAVCGWDMGYFGIQQLTNNQKLIIFSVWDSRQNDPNAVADEARTKLIYKDPAVRIGRFGNEGTGGQSFFDFDWQLGENHRFLVTAEADGVRTIYTGHFFVPEAGWKKLVAFSTITGGRLMRGCHGFVEDFRRNRISATELRTAQFGNGWQRSKGEWKALTKARFTADSNPVTTINARVAEGRFELATGADTTNSDTSLRSWMRLSDGERHVPSHLCTLMKDPAP